MIGHPSDNVYFSPLVVLNINAQWVSDERGHTRFALSEIVLNNKCLIVLNGRTSPAEYVLNIPMHPLERGKRDFVSCFNTQKHRMSRGGHTEDCLLVKIRLPSRTRAIFEKILFPILHPHWPKKGLQGHTAHTGRMWQTACHATTFLSASLLKDCVLLLLLFLNGRWMISMCLWKHWPSGSRLWLLSRAKGLL